MKISQNLAFFGAHPDNFDSDSRGCIVLVGHIVDRREALQQGYVKRAISQSLSMIPASESPAQSLRKSASVAALACLSPSAASAWARPQ